MSFELRGKLHKKFDTVQINERFRKREFVVEMEDGAYPQHIKMQLLQDRCGLLDDFSEGQHLKISFNIKGREYTNAQGEIMYFTNLEAWRFETMEATSSNPAPASEDISFPSEDDEPIANQDDLPF